MDRGRKQGSGQRLSCCGIPVFPRISCLRKHPASAGGSSESAKSAPEEDPSSESQRAPGTTKAIVAGRRLRSDSPTDDGASEAQPLKRQNSMGAEGEAPPVCPTASSKSQHQDASVFPKSHSFPPGGRPDDRNGSNRRAPGGCGDASVSSGSECPPYGSKSVIGRRAKMEDACVAIPNLLEVQLHREADELLPPRLAPQLRSSSQSSSKDSGEQHAAAAAAAAVAEVPEASTSSGSAATKAPQQHRLARAGTAHLEIPSPDDASAETLHFFGVFDGHGGADAAMHCAKTMHERLKDVLSALTSPSSGSEPAASAGPEASSADPTSRPLTDLNSNGSGSSESAAFLDAVDMVEAEGSGEGGLGPAASVEGVPCTTETVEAALTKAFHLTDEEFGEMGGYEHLALVGTTAVVALVGTRMIYVANCGDSRAVLCRDSAAVALTDDHKAAREDETARVEAAGGQILFWNGVRVMGLLAVSRAIGDHSLRPYVIAEPEVTVINRHSGDELLILASDGLWDVMSNQEACNLAKKCLLRARQRGSSRQSAARVAATVLTRAAVDRGSRDNVTVVIIDLTSPTDADIEAARLGSGASLGATHTSTYESGESGGIGGSGGGGGDPPVAFHSRSVSGSASDATAAVPASPFDSNAAHVHAPAPSPFETAGGTSGAGDSGNKAPITSAEALYRGSGTLPSPFSCEDDS